MTDYTQREIDNFHQEIKEALNRIESQTTRTNGRVTKLETKVWMMTGGLVVVSAIVVPLFLGLIK